MSHLQLSTVNLRVDRHVLSAATDSDATSAQVHQIECVVPLGCRWTTSTRSTRIS